MSGFYYSATTNGAYPQSDIEIYKATGTWPDDAVLMSAEVFSEFFSELPPAGKMRAAGPDGLPAWADIPKPSKEELINQAEQQRTALKAEADAQIAWRQDAVEVGIATEEEKSILAEWKKYRVLLMRIDTSKGPDIIWPPTP